MKESSAELDHHDLNRGNEKEDEEKDEEGNEKTSMVIRDLSEHLKSEEELKESEEKFREVFNNANDAMFLHKMKGRNPGNFLEVNDVACQILGYTRQELMNMSP